MIPQGVDFIEKEKIIAVEPDDDLQEVLTDYLIHSGHDFSMNIVVYPGKRPAHYLRAKIGEKTKGVFIPPKVYSMDDFVLDLHNQLFDTKPIDSIEGVAVIHRICKERGLLKEAFSELDNFFPVGEEIFSAIEELLIEYVPYEKLKEVDFLLDVPLKSKENINFLSTIYQQFYIEIENLKFSSRSKRYVDLAEHRNLEDHINCARLIFCGFYAFTEAEKRILKRLSKKDGFLFIYQKEGEINRDGREIHFYSAPDMHGEVKIVGEIIRKVGKIEGTAIILPKSDTLFPLLRHGISYISEEKYNVSIGYPLSRTPIYGFFMNLFELIDTFRGSKLYVPTYLKFLLHPYTKNVELEGSSERGRIVIHAVENILTKEIPLTFADLFWIEEELPSRIGKLYDRDGLKESEVRKHIENIHSNFIRPFFDIKHVKDFFQKCSSVLLFVYEKSTAHYHPLFYPYVEGYLNEFKRISSSLLGDHMFENSSSYFNLFKKLLASSFFPFEGDPKRGLQVLGFLETRNLKFKNVIFLDANEGVFPDLTEDFLLPYKVRKVLGLPTYKERENLIFHYFNTLLCGAEKVHILFLQNTENVKSRFIERIIWEMERKKGCLVDERLLIKGVGYRVSLANVIPPSLQKTENILRALEKIRLSPSAVDDYLRCGLRFYFRYVLKIGENDTDQEIDRTEIGNIVHLALRRFFEKRLGLPLSVENISVEEITNILDEIFSFMYGHYLDGKTYLTKRQIEKRLYDYITYLRSTVQRDRIRVLAVEEYVEEEFLDTTFGFRIDLVQERNGRVEIVDFKTSGEKTRFIFKAETPNLSERKEYIKLPSLQVPLYTILYAQKHGINPKDVSGFYLLLGEKTLDSSSLINPFKNLDVEDGIRTAIEVTSKVIEEIKDPSFPFLPPLDVLKTCIYCSYKALCGTLWVTDY